MKYLEPTENMWGLDIEGNGLDPTKLWCVCLVNLKTGQREHFLEAKSFKKWLKTNNPIFITHNGLKADIPWLNSLWKTNIDSSTVVDTFVLSQLFDPNLPKPEGLSSRAGTHSLEAWGLRIKSPKGDFSDWSKYSEEMLKYCFQDVEVTLKVYEQLAKKLKRLKFSEKSVDLEHQIVPIIHQQQQNGFHFDILGATKLTDYLRDKQRHLETNIRSVFVPRLRSAGVYQFRLKQDGTPYSSYLRHLGKYSEVRLDEAAGIYECFEYEDFNIGSPAQRLQRLVEAGYVPDTFTPKGNPKVDEAALEAFAEKINNLPEIKYIAEWLVLEGRANMIQTWLDNLGSDGRIHGNVFTCGAQSRRMKHSSPNTANIPGLDAKYGKEARSLWVARPGRVLVGVDAASLEGRMLLHHLNNKDAEDFFVNQKPHRLNADAIIKSGLDLGKDQHAQYQKAKTLLYAFLYGASDFKLATTVGSTDASVGALIRATLSRNVPGLAQLVERVQKEFRDNNGLLQCIDGGFVRCPSPHAALNYKLQPDGAILMKQALVLADAALVKARMDYMFVGNIHDEWQIDSKIQHADEIGSIASNCIKLAGEMLNFNVAQDGEYKIGFNWAETH